MFMLIVFETGCVSTQYVETPLMHAAKYGHWDVVRTLVNNGADVNGRNVDGFTTLMYAAGKGRLDVVQFVVDHGADVNAKTAHRMTPLMMAAGRGHLAVVQLE